MRRAFEKVVLVGAACVVGLSFFADAVRLWRK
jgi:hypothetical protein